MCTGSKPYSFDPSAGFQITVDGRWIIRGLRPGQKWQQRGIVFGCKVHILHFPVAFCGLYHTEKLLHRYRCQPCTKKQAGHCQP
nr:MAG TPA: hypothetical protein [Caudoviricetes sp.]